MGTQTFSYTGADQTFTVPAGVTTVTVDDQGAEGGQSGLPGGVPGKGGRVVCDLATTPGATLHITVGQHPTGAHPGSAAAGWPDGGAGCTANTAGDSGGGGGSSTVGIEAASDLFTRADSSSSLGTATSGQTWTALNGTWGISSNKGYQASATGQGAAVIDSGIADGVLSADVTLSSTPLRADCGLVFRCADDNNYMLFAATVTFGGTFFALYKRISGSFTQLATIGTPVVGTTYACRIVYSGTDINVFVDGVLLFTYSTSTGLEANTKVGIRVSNGGSSDDGGSRFDNLLVTSRNVIAGGGGGQGGNDDAVGHGGDGGGGNGSTGSVGDGNGSTNPSGGVGATTSAGGAAGASGGTVGTAGLLALGGAGGNVQRGGAGGGGGRYGGGGGVGANNPGQSGGGGGGGSGLGTGVNQTLTSGYRSGNGQVILTWTVAHGDHVLLTDSSALLESDNTSVVLLNGATVFGGSITVTANTIHEQVHVGPATPAVSTPYRLTPGFIPIA